MVDYFKRVTIDFPLYLRVRNLKLLVCYKKKEKLIMTNIFCRREATFLVLVQLMFPFVVCSFSFLTNTQISSTEGFQKTKTTSRSSSSPSFDCSRIDDTTSRREFFSQTLRTLPTGIGISSVPGLCSFSSVAIAADDSKGSLTELKALLTEARNQLNDVPSIIEKEEWDKVRAILITPPISECWTTTTRRGSNLLSDIAKAIGETPTGDELAVLELKEDAMSHLRYLDMAVYNNVFNPISTEGETGASKELIRSYYEDPKNELQASKKALDGIIAEVTSAIQ